MDAIVPRGEANRHVRPLLFEVHCTRKSQDHYCTRNTVGVHEKLVVVRTANGLHGSVELLTIVRKLQRVRACGRASLLLLLAAAVQDQHAWRRWRVLTEAWGCV